MPNSNVNESSIIESQIQNIITQLKTAAINKSQVPVANLRYRPLRPSDFAKFNSVVGTAAYSWSVASGTTTILSFTVPTNFAIAIFGLEASSNITSLVPGGYFAISVNNVERVQVPLADLANSQSGKIYFFDQALIVTQQENVAIAIDNPTTVSQTIGLWPASYIAAPASVLNVTS